ncbi:hypothetical protein AtubIFM56815_002981 [Aspergillus tubingensis]|uniref:NADP-dependent oxidoreductase domain-containing protein n=1 Tax=Aspergillus tubingensis TaxID=5068 RepID=A0A9W6AU99_ASPTU|nr:hypothetical protein AtubIFM54640_006783 [Aspergillus tubingensis]GLA88525.1 hypothetical protein AtubIFM56815_002981 [Aspergillus tubingensis]GLA94334.1 hypothetical protein AtubIFM57143_001314 [Aspergillus tubingensis]
MPPTSLFTSDIACTAVGFGTFQSDDGNGNIKQGVLQALRFGYRHIDTTIAYGNEREVGEVIKKSGISLEEIIVTTKLAQTWHCVSDVERALDLSLERLQLDYVNLYLMHCMAKIPSLPYHHQ